MTIYNTVFNKSTVKIKNHWAQGKHEQLEVMQDTEQYAAQTTRKRKPTTNLVGSQQNWRIRTMFRSKTQLTITAFCNLIPKRLIEDSSISLRSQPAQHWNSLQYNRFVLIRQRKDHCRAHLSRTGFALITCWLKAYEAARIQMHRGRRGGLAKITPRVE